MFEGLPEFAKWIKGDRTRYIVRFIAVFGIIYPFIVAFNLRNSILPDWLLELLALSLIPGVYLFYFLCLPLVAGLIGLFFGLKGDKNPRKHKISRSFENMASLAVTIFTILTNMVFSYIFGVLGLVIFLILDLRIESKFQSQEGENRSR